MAKIKSAIQFGLVYIPIVLHSCTKNTDIGFNLLYKKTGERIKYKKTCENCPAKISPEDIVKGYEYERGKYVVLTSEELTKLKSKKDENIEILEFVSLNEIDPIYFDDSYFVEPAGAKNAYALLAKALESEKKVGIAKTVIGTKESIIALRVIDGKLVISKLHFAEEIQENPVQKIDISIKSEELDLAKKLINNMTKKFDVTEFKDEYKQRVLDAIDKKIAGQSIKKVRSERPKTIINLMDALQQSLQNEKDNVVKINTKKSQRKRA